MGRGIILHEVTLQVNVKFTLEQAMKAQRGSTLSLTSALDGGGW
jgi:hypothetical protein